MRKLFKPASFGLYVLLLLNFFLLGAYVAGVLGVAKNQGLAGGAIVFGWGVLFAGIAFICGLFLAYYVSTKLLVKINIFLLIVFVLAIGTLYVLNTTRFDKKKPAETEEIQRKPTAPTTVPLAIDANVFKGFLNKRNLKDSFKTPKETVMGIGYFMPNYFENKVLYFYGGINPEKSITEHMPMDSLGFEITENYMLTTTYGPPWLYPAYLKTDYELVAFKVLAMGYDFLKVEVNKETGQIAYIDKHKGTFKPWPEFLLTVNSVEFLDRENQKVHSKPLDFSATVTTEFEFLKPIMVQHDWMQVQLLDDNYRSKGTGWIQWRKNGKLLISTNLLT